MNGIALVITLAVTVEAMVDYVKCFYDYITGRCYKKLVTRIAALVISILLCIAACADIFAAIGVVFRLKLMGTVLTGIFASRGANYISDLLSKINKKPS